VGNIRKTYEKRGICMAKKTDKELKAEHKEKLKEVKGGHKTDIKELKNTHKADIKELKDEHKAEIKKLDTELKGAQKTTINVDGNENKISIHHEFALHPIIVDWFGDTKNVPAARRPEILAQAINVGLLAIMENRVEGIISRINADIDADLSMIVKKMQLLETRFHKDTNFNTQLEDDVRKALESHANHSGWKDRLVPSGDSGGVATNKISRNMTGDVEISVIDDDGKLSKVAVEVKFNKAVAEGAFEDFKADQGSKDTAWSQIIEARWNRESPIGIFVVDKEKLNPKIKSLTESVAYVPEVRGFVCVVDVLSNDYSNACIAYGLARTISLASRDMQFYEPGVLDFIIQRTQHTLRRRETIKKISKTMVTDLVKSLTSLENDLVYVDQALEFLQSFIDEYSRTGTITAESMFDLYSQEEVKVNVAIESKEFKKELDDTVKEAKNAALPPPTIEEVAIEPEPIEGDADEPMKANDELDYSSMKKDQLKALLKERGLPTSGTKDVLIERLNKS
jgi:hypothetical protein